MNRVPLTLTLIGLLAGGAAVAQTSQSQTSPSSQPSQSSQYPSGPASSSDSSQSSSQSDQSSGSNSEGKAMKDCVAQQRANNPQISKRDAKKTCKAQMGSSKSNPSSGR